MTNLGTEQQQNQSIPSNAGIFFDRDGTLNCEVDYLHKVKDFCWSPGALDALQYVHALGYKIFVVSNQSGIARGMYSMQDVKQIEQYMIDQLKKVGVTVCGWEYCPHHPDVSGACDCRKPQNGMLETLIAKHHVDRLASWMIGDQLRDLQAGVASGMKVAGVYANKRSTLIAQNGYLLFNNLYELVQSIPLQQQKPVLR